MIVYNAHSHYGVEIYDRPISLKSIFNHSYVGWQNELISEDLESIVRYFVKNKTMNAFVQLKKALEDLYGNGLMLDENTWHVFDERLKKAHDQKGYDHYVLKERCGYEEILLDDYIQIRSDGSNGVSCKVSLRCDFMFYGYSKEALLTSEALPFEFFDHIPNNITDYTNKVVTYIEESLSYGKCSAIKVCMAYFRDLSFERVSPKQAEQVYGDTDNPHFVKQFQDYVMDLICKTAEKYDIPIQIHTGLGQIQGTSAIELIPLFNRFPKVKFVLLHGSFPWIDDLLAVLYAYPNTYVDVCWVPLLSKKMAVDTLVKIMELIGYDRIIWGCDTSSVEESYGALKVTLEILDQVNTYFIGEGVYDQVFATHIKESIMYLTAKQLFHR